MEITWMQRVKSALRCRTRPRTSDKLFRMIMIVKYETKLVSVSFSSKSRLDPLAYPQDGATAIAAPG
ncbi:hypothetical protein DT037_20960 [Pseudomonas fulva]|nr:hypothetical protein [Pseudomonas fulva]